MRPHCSIYKSRLLHPKSPPLLRSIIDSSLSQKKQTPALRPLGDIHKHSVLFIKYLSWQKQDSKDKLNSRQRLMAIIL